MQRALYDYIIIGGGIIGLSTAWQLKQRQPNSKILLLEKEQLFAQHQTGRNSGVIHAGVYYRPNSLKAELCRKGILATIEFCRTYNIPFLQCGKLLVATTEIELQGMIALLDRCRENQIAVELLDQQQLVSLEPEISGLGAILVKKTGIVDYGQIATAMAAEFKALGGEYQLGTAVKTLTEKEQKITVSTNKGIYHSRFLIACAGLMADRLARCLNIPLNFQIMPFRGEYYQLPRHYRKRVKHLIYPIPNPELPFLGVHLTPMIDGSITVGPNAVLGWKREGYGGFNFDWRDTTEMLLFKGFWGNLKQNIRPGIVELKNSLMKTGYLKQVQKYCPQISLHDLQPYPVGIRAQAVMADGSLAQDFLFAESDRSLHVCNAPSPAATSAIPIGAYLCNKILSRSM